jgi:hypothetical protein
MRDPATRSSNGVGSSFVSVLIGLCRVEVIGFHDLRPRREELEICSFLMTIIQLVPMNDAHHNKE